MMQFCLATSFNRNHSLPPLQKNPINKDLLIILPLKVYINSKRVFVHKRLCSACLFTHVCTSALALLSFRLHEANIQSLSLKPSCKLVADKDNGCSKVDHQFVKERCRFVRVRCPSCRVPMQGVNNSVTAPMYMCSCTCISTVVHVHLHACASTCMYMYM